MQSMGEGRAGARLKSSSARLLVFHLRGNHQPATSETRNFTTGQNRKSIRPARMPNPIKNFSPRLFGAWGGGFVLLPLPIISLRIPPALQSRSSSGAPPSRFQADTRVIARGIAVGDGAIEWMAAEFKGAATSRNNSGSKKIFIKLRTFSVPARPMFMRPVIGPA